MNKGVGKIAYLLNGWQYDLSVQKNISLIGNFESLDLRLAPMIFGHLYASQLITSSHSKEA